MSQTRKRLYLTRIMAMAILLLFACGTTAWSLTNSAVEELLFFVGIAVAGFGAAGRAWATSFISGNKSRQLVSSGPYSLCRNPLYLFSWLIGVGIGFCTETFTGGILIGIGLIVLYYFQIRREEKHLMQIFGQPYEQYLATVPRFFPSWRAYNEPDEIRISPHVMKRGMFGIAFLLMLIGAMELLEISHQSGLLPSLFRLY